MKSVKYGSLPYIPFIAKILLIHLSLREFSYGGLNSKIKNISWVSSAFHSVELALEKALRLSSMKPFETWHIPWINCK